MTVVFYSENASATSNIFNFFCVSLGERTRATLGVSFPGGAIDAPPQRRNLVVTRSIETNRRVIAGGNRKTERFIPASLLAQIFHVAFECGVALLSTPTVSFTLWKHSHYELLFLQEENVPLNKEVVSDLLMVKALCEIVCASILKRDFPRGFSCFPPICLLQAGAK